MSTKKAAAKKAAPKKAGTIGTKSVQQKKDLIASGSAMLISNELAKEIFGAGVIASTEVVDLSTGSKVKLSVEGQDGIDAFYKLDEAVDEFNTTALIKLKEKQLDDHLAGVPDRTLSEDALAELRKEIAALITKKPLFEKA